MPQRFYNRLRIAKKIWEEIREAGQPADRWLRNYFHKHRKQTGAADRRFLAEVTYSAFRHKLLIEAWLQDLGIDPNSPARLLLAAASDRIISDKEFISIAGPLVPESKPLEQIYSKISAHQLPEKLILESDEQRLSVQYSFPAWLVQRWIRRFGPSDAEHLLSASQARPPLVVRTNPIKCSREDLLARFRRTGILAEPSRLSSLGILFRDRINMIALAEYRDGLCEIQDEGSQLICEWIRPIPGETVWDVCAGGGGKALALSGWMKNQGRIIATDIRAWKLDELRKRAKRSGIFNIFPADIGQLSSTKAMKNGVDRILVDAPCSGIGTLRRNPDGKWRVRAEDLPSYARDQLAILESSLTYLKKGGFLYYVTCSLEPEENEQVATRFMESHASQLALAPNPAAKDGYYRLLPHRDGTDGFFMAVFRLVTE